MPMKSRNKSVKNVFDFLGRHRLEVFCLNLFLNEIHIFGRGTKKF